MQAIVRQAILSYLPHIMFIAVMFLISLVSYEAKQWIAQHKDLIEHQREVLIQQIGKDKYDMLINKTAVICKAVEQDAKSLDWNSFMKHDSAVQRLCEATGISEDEAHNLVESFVGDFNKDKAPKTESTLSIVPPGTTQTAQPTEKPLIDYTKEELIVMLEAKKNA